MWCKINFRFYLLLLCAVYFTMLYIFHGSLQTETKKSGMESQGKTAEMPNGILKIKSPIDAKRKVLASHQDLPQTTRKSAHIKHILATTVRKEHKNEFININNKNTYQTIKKHSNCFLPATSPNRTFLALEPKFYVYSAYMDERYGDTKLRIMAILSMIKTNRNLKAFCNFRTSTGLISKQPASFYELCENHGRQFGGFILSCPVQDADICHINVSLKIESVHHSYIVPETIPVHVPVSQIKPQLTKDENSGSIEKRLPYNFTICVPPLFGDIDATRFIEFIELNKLLGFQHFIFYISNIKNPDMFKVLDFYRKEGIVTTIDWILPSSIHSGHIWYNGQLSAHNDCLYRAMSLTQFLAIIDLDEFIVPHNGEKSLTKTIPKLFSEKVCGLSFDSAFYDKKFSQSKSQSRLVTVRHTGRSAVFSNVRTKVIVKPSKIFEVGIHHISKPAQEDFKVEKVDTAVAYLHHYRDCVPNFNMKCNAFTEDNTLLNYSSNLEDNVSYVLKLVFPTRG